MHYVEIDPRDAAVTDEFRLNGRWHRAARVIHRGDRIEVRWPQGGAMSGPTANLAGRVRRPVCGSLYGPGDLMCTEAPGHAGEHTAPTGDDDGVWAWA